MTAEKDSWIGQQIGPWVVKYRRSNGQGKALYVCHHIDLKRDVGIAAYRLNKVATTAATTVTNCEGDRTE